MVQQESVTNGPTVSLNTVQLEKVCKDYVDGQVVHALRDMDLTIAHGERVAIIGPSGSGNSSLKSFDCFQTNQETTLIFHGHA